MTDDKLREYERLFQDIATKSSEQYDKAILTLSGGAIALSVTFVKSFDKVSEICLLSISWVAWSISILSVIISFLTCQFGIRKALKHIKKHKNVDGINNGYNDVTSFLNILSGATFIIGTVLFLSFANQTIKGDAMTKETKILTEQQINELAQKISENVITELNKKGYFFPITIDDEEDSKPVKEKPKNK